MKDLALKILSKLPKVEYADVRVVRQENESIATKDGVVEALESSENYGFGVRVIVAGCWGFAASDNFERKNILKVVKKAIDIAKASAIVRGEEVVLDKQKYTKATYKTPIKIDPFQVPLSQKIKLLLKADKAQRITPKIKISQTYMRSFRETKTFANSEGSLIDQEIVWCGGGIEATVIDKHDLQARTYPNSFRGQFKTGGYEVVESLNLVENAPKIAKEAVELLTADQCPSGEFDLILDGNQLGLQIHESCGHPAELDRVLGYEASFAGTSFLTTDKLGKFRYGSDIVNLTADATIPGGLATFGFDDEGVPAQRAEIVKNGILVGYLTSRETAPILSRLRPGYGEAQSNGAARADGWSRMPLIRMTNVNLEPGLWDLAALIADTKYGIFMSTNKSWSIDDRRLNFQFGTEIAWEIKNGKKGRILKNPTYTGITPKFWQSCDAICNKKYWELWGTPNCGKGEPEQVMFTGHGAAPARFRKVKVGIGKWSK
jgi:TldD protein